MEKRNLKISLYEWYSGERAMYWVRMLHKVIWNGAEQAFVFLETAAMNLPQEDYEHLIWIRLLKPRIWWITMETDRVKK